jgi:predicted  nucleic acid-binding Zn-ribbon protein
MMMDQWEIIQGLVICLVSLFSYMLKDHMARLEKENTDIRNDLSKAKEDIANFKENYTSQRSLQTMLNEIEKQIITLERNLTDKMELHMQVIDQRLKSK